MNRMIKKPCDFSISSLRAHRRFCRVIAGVSSFVMLTTMSAPAFAGTAVLGGDAVLTDATGATLNSGSATDAYAQFVSTGGASAVLDWSQFNIGAGKEMNFSGSGTTFFNLVDSAASKSQIDGIISGNGSVWVINPNGIAFGASSQVNVGALFAAAAGNISNADQLREGTATLPTFSSFDGQVSTMSGSMFKGDRVALLSNTVSVDGADMQEVGYLAIGAAKGMTVVDDVAEGLVRIDITDFASDSTANSVELGDLALGGGVDIGYGVPMASRGLRVDSGNGVKVTGEVNTDGSAFIYARNGDVRVADSGKINGNGIFSEIDLYAGIGENSRGDVIVEGRVKADSGIGLAVETVYAYAGYGTGRVGSEGNVKVDGVVKASGAVDMRSFGAAGTIEVGDAGALISRYDGVKMFAGSSVWNAGSVAAGNGIVYATGHADGVNLNVGSGLVVAQSVCAQTDGDAAVVVNSSRNFITYLDDSRANSSQQAEISADPAGVAVNQSIYQGIRDYYDGNCLGLNLVVWDDIVDSGSIGLRADNLTVLNGASILSAADLQLSTPNGSVFTGKSSLLSAGNYASIYAAGNSSLLGTMDVGSVDIITGGDVELGNITARAYNLYSGDMDGDGVADPSSIGVSTLSGSISLRDGAHLTATYDSGGVYLMSAKSVYLGKDSAVSANGADGIAYVTGYGSLSDSEVAVNGTVEAGDMAQVAGSPGNVTIGETGTVRGGQTAYITSLGGTVAVNGTVESDDTVFMRAADAVEIGGTVHGKEITYVESDTGDIAVSGQLLADGEDGNVILRSGRNVVFSPTGSMSAESSVAIVAKGDLGQTDARVPYQDGWMDSVSLRPAVTAPEVVLEVGGSIGGGKDNPFVLEGKAWAVAFGDMSLAAGNGTSLQGGNASSVAEARDSVQYTISSARKMIDGTLTIEEAAAREAMKADFDDNALLYSAGSMYLYTASQLEANSYVGAGNNMTVSAATFGDMSYLDAGGWLTINNVGYIMTPQIAYFESVNGVEPTINNQPNDTVIFVDGRLAGGNLKILNQFGASEAFLVQTPELKSTQGIFGNPTFLHSDLDVANPMEVSAIDYMLQETPRLTLDKDFPKEADQHVDSVVIPEKDSIQFGREAKNETVTTSDDKVAMVR